MDRLPPTTSNTFDIIHDTEKFCVTKHAGERKNTHYPLTHPPPHLDFLLKALQSNSITNYHCKPLLLHFLLLRYSHNNHSELSTITTLFQCNFC
jgi:hypothetical protein